MLKQKLRNPLLFLGVFGFVIVSVTAYKSGVFMRQDEASREYKVMSQFSSCERYPKTDDFARSERYRCYSRLLTKGPHKYGLQTVARAFDQYVRSGSSDIIRGGMCHLLGHDLGLAAVMQNYTPEEILSYCSDACADGCFNGAGHAYLALGNSIEGINEFCAPNKSEPLGARNLSCFHGFGHGLTDVFGVSLEENLKRCNVIQSEEGKYQCGHALFMALSTISDPRTQLSSLPAFPELCYRIDAVYQDSCFMFSGYLTYGKFFDEKEAFSVCGKVPEQYQTWCHERIGESIFLASVRNTAKVKENCFSGGPVPASECLRGAALAATNDTNSTLEAAKSICQFNTTEEFQNSCYRIVGEGIEYHRGEEDRQRFCDHRMGRAYNECVGS